MINSYRYCYTNLKIRNLNTMSKTTKSKIEPTNKNGKIYFADEPEFQPNITPSDMFRMGSFGGTYWRPIESKFYEKTLKNHHKKYPKSWWDGIPDDHLTRPFKKYDPKINKYKKKVGTTLEFWEGKNWIVKQDPYGWVQWYCEFYLGRRSNDDERQIRRWKQLAGPNGRFRKWLVTQILKHKGKWNDFSVSPAIRQTLQHWGYQLTEEDFDTEISNRKK